jgi:hypothetical protein
MRYVIIRDDDTNALTPVDCLERLYRPFLDRGLPVNLAVIPNVATDTTLPDGRPEGFLLAKNGTRARYVAIGSNKDLVGYLLNSPGYHIVQHGYHHDYFEFDRDSLSDISRRLDEGTRLLAEAGLGKPQTFVAPYDKFSRTSMREVARRFKVISTGWFELGRLPISWWPAYATAKKIRRAPHWRKGNTVLLSHPGCLLSCHRSRDSMLDEVIKSINSRRVTVLVTHWWEYFRDNRPDARFIQSLHQTAEYLSEQPDVKVISFSDLTTGKFPLN